MILSMILSTAISPVYRQNDKCMFLPLSRFGSAHVTRADPEGGNDGGPDPPGNHKLLVISLERLVLTPLGPLLNSFKRRAKALIKLRICAG